MLQHGVFSNSKIWNIYDRFIGGFAHSLMSDKQSIWDKLTQKHAMSFGKKEGNILLTGSPRHDIFFNAKRSLVSNGTILLATTSIPKLSVEMSPFESHVKYEKFIHEVCHVVKKFPDKKLIVKPHPHYDILINITEMIKQIDPNIPITYDTNLVELINSCDVLITFNNSTIALEAMMLNKPVISLQSEKWAEEDNIVKMNAVLSVTKIEEIEDAIQKLLYEEKFRSDLLHNAKIFLENFANRGYASKALAKILDDF